MRIFSSLPLPTSVHVSDHTNTLVSHYHKLAAAATSSSAAALNAGAEGVEAVWGGAPLCVSQSVTFANPNEPLQVCSERQLRVE